MYLFVKAIQYHRLVCNCYACVYMLRYLQYSSYKRTVKCITIMWGCRRSQEL